jgi:hypothetical protein
MTALLMVLALCLTGCFGGDQAKLLKSDMPLTGMEASVSYRIDASTDGTSETNQATLTGMNTESPMPLTTTFGKGAGTTTQLVQATGPDGNPVNVLSMTKASLGFGLTRYLKTDVATYEMRDTKGSRVCGAKVRLNFQPNAVQLFGKDGQGYDALWYYSVPCDKADPKQQLDISHAKLIAVVITQQTTPRITGKPILFNRGHSVTIVGGPAAALQPGWWTYNARKGNNNSILGAADMTESMVKDLNSSSQPWLAFNPSGRFAASNLVYSAGDADVYTSFKRVFLNRQSDYIVNFRSSPTEAWRRIVVHPLYNIEWNDLAQQFKAIKGFNPLKVDSKIDKNGFPKDANDSVLKEIERSGCQNCSNSTLEQVQWRDGDTGKILYANTLRAYLGASSTLSMFGQVPSDSLSTLQKQANTGQQKSQGLTDCPVRYDSDGKKAKDQLSQDQCANLLREGAVWNLITEDPHTLGLDLVSQFRVADNSTWSSVCTGSGKDTSCNLVAQNEKLDASYLFSQTDTTIPWSVLQTLGEVGMRMLGYSYVSGPGTGSGMDFAMAQSVVRQQYQTGITNPEMIFALDARALQLPYTLGQAAKELYGPAA